MSITEVRCEFTPGPDGGGTLTPLHPVHSPGTVLRLLVQNRDGEWVKAADVDAGPCVAGDTVKPIPFKLGN